MTTGQQVLNPDEPALSATDLTLSALAERLRNLAWDLDHLCDRWHRLSSRECGQQRTQARIAIGAELVDLLDQRQGCQLIRDASRVVQVQPCLPFAPLDPP